MSQLERETKPAYAVLGEPLTLPCGVAIPNRIVKAAMTEQLADKNHAPNDGERPEKFESPAGDRDR